MKKFINYSIATAFAALVIVPATAQEKEKAKLEFDFGADLVSSYVWRGLYQAGFSVQPSMTLSYAGFSLGAWGSTDLSGDSKELDFSLFYQTGGFTVGITDYWWAGQGAAYFDYNDNHYLEGTIGYTFGEKFPLSLRWNTIFLFESDRNVQDKKMYSTMIEASYPFRIKTVEMSIGLGVTPWESIYDEKANVSYVSLGAAKQIKITGSFSLPIFSQLIFSPATDDAFLVFGLSF